MILLHIGADLLWIGSPESIGLGPARQEQLLRDGSLVFETEFVRKDGSLVPVEASAKVLSREGAGLRQAFVGDIAERKRAEAIIRASHDLLEFAATDSLE